MIIPSLFMLGFTPPYEHWYSLAILPSRLVNLSINLARFTSMRGHHEIPQKLMLGFPSFEHWYSLANTAIYAFNPQYYLGKIYINAGAP